MKSAVALAISTLAWFGCAHGDADGDRRLVQLREELARVQADRDRVDQRLVALETQVTTPAKSESKPSAPPPTPPLRVVRLGADGTSESTSAEETASSIDEGSGARPILRVTGAPGTRHARGAKQDVIVETLPPDAPDAPDAASGVGATAIRERAPRPSALDPDARRAYDDALALVRGKKCQAALDAFAGFIVRWPDHPNADNAMYWRGECYAELGDLPRAIEQFEGTIARFPLGNKVPDALLKLGLSYAKLGNQARAKEAFDRLAREFPKSEASRRIPQGASTTP